MRLAASAPPPPSALWGVLGNTGGHYRAFMCPYTCINSSSVGLFFFVRGPGVLSAKRKVFQPSICKTGFARLLKQ